MFFLFIIVIFIVVLVLASSSKNGNGKQSKTRMNDVERYFEEQRKKKEEAERINLNKIQTSSSANFSCISQSKDKKLSNNTEIKPDNNRTKVETSASNSVVINGHLVEYFDSTHIYRVDGKEVPCVSDILSYYSHLHHLDDYSYVSQTTLYNAALKGTALHHAVEFYEKNGFAPSNYQEIENYKRFKNQYDFEVEKMEQIVLYCDNEGKPLYAGRLDMIINIEGCKAIMDLKRTYKIYHRKFQLQLNLYRLAYEQSYKQRISKLYCMRLRDDIANFIELDIDENTAHDSLNVYMNQ